MEFTDHPMNATHALDSTCEGCDPADASETGDATPATAELYIGALHQTVTLHLCARCLQRLAKLAEYAAKKFAN